LEDRDLGSPAPEEKPEELERKFSVGKPGMGEEGESNSTFFTTISTLRCTNMP
jgi:hypothetical protein